MAKVTLILEDTLEPDGSAGLTISYDADEPETRASIAHSYAASFVDYIVGNAKKAVIMDKDAVEIDTSPNQKNPKLN